MAKYRKKPVVVEAVEWRLMAGGCPPEHYPDRMAVKRRWFHGGWWIKTLEGWMQTEPGDWIITGVQGERYPCKPDIFVLTYEAVEE